MSVPTHLLRCPTCHEFYPKPLTATEIEPLMPITSLRAQTGVQLHRGWYVRCANGHRWKLRELTRYSDGRPDEVTLNCFLGTGP